MDNDAIFRTYGQSRLNNRQIDELVGLSKGIVADGMVNQTEAEFLQKWLVSNTALNDNPIVGTLLKRVDEMLHDGVLSDEEGGELLDTLHRFNGGDFELGEIQKSSLLPFDDPPPDITFKNKRFCFTGTFAYGPRKECRHAVEKRGGIEGSLTKKTDYLVVGLYATGSWKHSTFGNKIEKAISYRSRDTGIAIVGEQHWFDFVDSIVI